MSCRACVWTARNVISTTSAFIVSRTVEPLLPGAPQLGKQAQAEAFFFSLCFLAHHMLPTLKMSPVHCGTTSRIQTEQQGVWRH